MYRTIGIIGGMGPAATCDLMQKIITHTLAPNDQSHIRLLVDSNTNIPDRTAAILHGGADPVPQLRESARLLAGAGAVALIMPCNTAHYFYDAVQESVSIPVLHMPRETAALLRSRGITKAGVLATDGTVQTGVYEKALREAGVEPVYPAPEHQADIMELIYGYVKKGITAKAQLPVEKARAALEDLRSRGAQTVLLACTELPIAFESMELSDGCVDPTLVLACAAIRFAGAPLAEEP